MNDVTNIQPPRDPFNHPHAKIVKRLVEDYFKTLASKVSGGNSKLRIRNKPIDSNKITEIKPCYSADLILTNSNTGMLRPVGAEIELIKDLPQAHLAIKKLTDSYETTLNALNFFLKHNYEHYVQENMTPLLEVKEICIATLDLIKKLDPYCLSVARYYDSEKKRKPFTNSRGDKIKIESLLVMRFVLKDEYSVMSENYTNPEAPKADFRLSMFIMSPAEVLRVLFYYRNLDKK
jgi:hypothetical protein